MLELHCPPARHTLFERGRFEGLLIRVHAMALGISLQFCGARGETARSSTDRKIIVVSDAPDRRDSGCRGPSLDASSE